MLPPLFLSTDAPPEGGKRPRDEETWSSVKLYLPNTLLARQELHGNKEVSGDHIGQWMDEVPFRYTPIGAEDGHTAEFLLVFDYEEGREFPFGRIHLHRPIDEYDGNGPPQSCVDATYKIPEAERNPERGMGSVPKPRVVPRKQKKSTGKADDSGDSSLHIDSLYYIVRKEAPRPKCGFQFVGKGIEGGKGEGAIVLGALVNIAAAFRIETVTLVDAAEFAVSPPIWGKVPISNYLRIVRGYGQYEGLGFFSEGRTPDEAQADLDFNHTLTTTPIKNLKAEKVFSALVLYELRNNSFALNKGKVMSLREVVRSFEKAMEETRFPNDDVTRAEEVVPVELLSHFNLANTIVQNLSFSGSGVRLGKQIEYDDGGGVSGWEVVQDGRGAPKLERGPLRDEYTFNTSLAERTPWFEWFPWFE